MQTYKPLAWLTIFSIAMGYLETTVVVYLRKIYYPAGFQFPMVAIEPSIAITEIGREVATVVMLAGIAILVGKNKLQRFAFFLYCFAIWDLCYYLFLKVLLNWPESLLTWDILFLIPLPWFGPVLAPCLLSLNFILFTFLVLYIQKQASEASLSKLEKSLMLFGALIAVISFVYEYVGVISSSNIIQQICFTPQYYNWYFFLIGQLAFLASVLSFSKRYLVFKQFNTIKTHYHGS